VGFFVMLTGIGIIGALASIFAAVLVSPSKEDDVSPAATSSDDEVRDELRAIRRELAALRAASGRDDEPQP
jgi:hypothetical protein